MGGAPTGDPDTATAHDPFAGHPVLTARVANIAHRGGAALRPEETMAAYRHADELGADMLELDVWATSDGHLVLNHDATVDRTTDGTGRIDALTWAEVRALDAGYAFTRDGGASYPYRGQGLQIAGLSEVLEAFPEQLFHVEIKAWEPALVAPVLDAVEAAGLHDRVVIFSFADPVVQEVRRVDPTVLTALGTAEALALHGLTADAEGTYTPPAPVFVAPREGVGLTLDEGQVAKAHRVGVHVHVWTVNDPDDMDAVLDWGVDGVITDDPDTLEAKLRSRGLAP